MKKGWEIKKLGKIIKLEYGKPLEKTKRNTDGKYPVYGANGIKAFSDEFYYDEKTIIIGRKGSAGEINLTKEKFWPLDVTYFVKYDKNQMKLEFLYFLLSLLNLPKLAKGVKPGINRNDVYNIEVPIPPLPEQKRIVFILDRAFEAIDKAKANAEQNLKNAKEVFESYLNRIFEEKGEDWEEKTLKDVCKIIGGGTPSKKNEEFYNGNIYWATVRDMKSDIIKNTEFKITSDAVTKSSTNIIPKDNVIIATRVGLGKVCIIENDTAINQDLKGIIPKNSKQLSIRFLFRWFKSISNKIIDEGTGATVQGVKLTFINSLKISFPPIETQKQIVAQLDKLQAETKKLEAIYQQKINDLEELKKSILQKAFNGEL